MRTEMNRRIATLETAAGVGDDLINVIIRTFVRPSASGPEDCPLKAVVNGGKPWRLDRELGETREAFLERATRLVPRPAHGVASLREVL